MRDVVICQPLRTPVGRFGGVFRDLDANTLATGLLTALVERTGLTGADVDDVVLGQGSPNGEGPAIGRIAALDSPLGIDVPGMQLDRRCGSGLQAIITGALQVASGGMDLVVAGGVESMSQVEFYASPSPRWGIRGDGISLVDRLGRARTTVGGRSHIIDGGMIETAENLRREYGISRDEQDRLAVQSHQRAVAAQESGAFAEEIVPVTVPQRKGDDLVVDTDEHPRADSSVEALARLRPIMGRTDPEATVTAGNASGQNDGAAMCVVTTADRAAALGLTPLVRLASWAVAGVAPETMGIGPVPATAKALDRLGLTLADMDVIELNEAFAAQALSVMREWDIDPTSEHLNPHGSGISLGHPVGATGARMLVTASHQLQRTDAKTALVTMCIGGGQGLAAVIEKEGN